MKTIWLMALAGILGLTPGMTEEPSVIQKLDIPHRTPSAGKLPSFRVVADGVQVGRVIGDAMLSNGRFFGIRWIAVPEAGKRVEILEGNPTTLNVWLEGRIEIIEE